MVLSPENIDLGIRLCVATVLGGVIGFERELAGKGAGFRTYSLVSLGSALVMSISIHVFSTYHGMANADPGRIAAQVVAGIGFLGAGTIIRSGDGVKGLTTAAGLWTVSAIGLACGLGYYSAAFFATVITLVVLVIFSQIDRVVRKRDRNNI